MRIIRYKSEKIVSKLRQVEALVQQGNAQIEAANQGADLLQPTQTMRPHGTDQLRELRRLRIENERLRKAVSDLRLDKKMLAEATSGNYYALRVVANACIIMLRRGLVLPNAERLNS